MYDPDKQYRCTIIRGKAKSDLDNLLPFYSSIVEKLCPCEKTHFDRIFNNELSNLFFNAEYDSLSHGNQKTIRNHITEIAGKLFGLYYEKDGYIEISESCKLLLETGDNPAFFKNLCLNFQFPNGTQKASTIIERMNDGIKVKPFHFVVSLLSLAFENNIILTKQEIAYYVLNSLEVLQGLVNVNDVYDRLMSDRNNGIMKPHLQGSKQMQHISEQLNLLELANVIRQEKGFLHLNIYEETIIDIFKKELFNPFFDVSRYACNETLLDTIFTDWGKYYGEVRYGYDILQTRQDALTEGDKQKIDEKIVVKPSTVQIGDRGELFVFEKEKERVRNYKERHVNKVLLLGKIKGLGYDIASIEAEGDEPDFARYIEVKTTIRVTEPNLSETWRDSVTLTAKEWTAAKQYRDHYNVYRVYFTPIKTIVYRINNPYNMFVNSQIDVYPTMYQMDIKETNITNAFNE